MKKSGLINLINSRKEATALLIEKGKYHEAYEGLGYVIEYALKVAVCKHFGRENYPDEQNRYKTHNYNALLYYAGLNMEFAQARVLGSELHKNWSIITKWNPEMRYDDAWPATAEVLSEYWDAVFNERDGIFTWISSKW